MKRAQRKFLIGFGIVIVAIGYLIYTGFNDTTLYYLTVSELHASPVYGTNLRLNGHVVPGSIQKDKEKMGRVRFIAEEGGKETTVVYVGFDPIPDTFRDEAEVVVEGTYAKDRTFTAHKLFAKCPSKYEGESMNPEKQTGTYPGSQSE